jgi:hypothetical protein
MAPTNLVFSQAYDDLSRAVRRANLLCKIKAQISDSDSNARARGRPKGSKDTKPRKRKELRKNKDFSEKFRRRGGLVDASNHGKSSLDVISIALSSSFAPNSSGSKLDVRGGEYEHPHSRMSIYFLLD